MQSKDLKKNDYINVLNEHLSMLRAQSGMNQSELAKIAGIARTTYSAVESKKRKMTVQVFTNLARYFLENEKTVSVMELLGLTSESLEPFFQVDNIINQPVKSNSRKKVAAFGGNVSKKSDSDKQRKIEKALKGIDQ